MTGTYRRPKRAAALARALAVAPAVLLAACSAAPETGAGFGGSGGASSSSSSTSSSGAGGTGGADVVFDAGASDGGKKGGVPQTCAEAIEQKSYIGCEYWPSVTSNSGLYPGFQFAVAAANPTTSPATVTVTKAAAQIAQVEVEPGQLQTIALPWVDELKQEDAVGDGSGLASVHAKAGAYRVTSSVPITLYQFNPLEFELIPPPADCQFVAELGGCFSFTNDASLVLPTTALRGDYFVMSAPTLHIGSDPSTWLDLPGFAAITATEDGTTVQVTSSAHVRAGAGVQAMGPGDQQDWTLDAGDVLMLLSAAPPPVETPQPNKPCTTDPDLDVILCPTAQEYDLTGTRIHASKPVSVLGGHDCTFVPYDRFACDHIEESIFPIDALGQDLVVTAPRAVSSIEKPAPVSDFLYMRVLSAADDNTITFDPPLVAPAVTLGTGQWIEIGPVSQDVRVTADDKILVAQYMVGENYAGVSAGAGDPSLSIAIPTEQYRTEYAFLAPATYTHNLVNVVAPANVEVLLDGAPIPPQELVSLGATGLVVARHVITGGTHTVKSTLPFGIVVYGYGSYTSYMYPGGLDLNTIVITPK